MVTNAILLSAVNAMWLGVLPTAMVLANFKSAPFAA